MFQQSSQVSNRRLSGRLGGISGRARIIAAVAGIGLAAALAGAYWSVNASGGEPAGIANSGLNARPIPRNLDALVEGPVVSSATNAGASENLDSLAEGPIVSSASVALVTRYGELPNSRVENLDVLVEGPIVSSASSRQEDLSVLVEGPIVSSASR